MMTHEPIPQCCFIGCDQQADYALKWPPFGYEDNTFACIDHLEHLYPDKVNTLVKRLMVAAEPANDGAHDKP